MQRQVELERLEMLPVYEQRTEAVEGRPVPCRRTSAAC
jgi:hypothetical protein